MPPKIIALTEEHAEAIHQIALKSFESPWTQEDFSNFLAHPCRHHWGIEVDGTLQAYLMCLEVHGELDTLSIATRPEARCRGYGEALLRHLQSRPVVKSIFLEVEVTNLAAIGLYQRVGFQRMGIRKKYYASLRDALQMRWKKLDSGTGPGL